MEVRRDFIINVFILMTLLVTLLINKSNLGYYDIFRFLSSFRYLLTGVQSLRTNAPIHNQDAHA